MGPLWSCPALTTLGTLTYRFLIDIDSKTRFLHQFDEAILNIEITIIDELVVVCGSGPITKSDDLFLNQEVWRCKVKLQACSKINRTKRAMWRHAYVIRFSESSNSS